MAALRRARVRLLAHRAKVIANHTAYIKRLDARIASIEAESASLGVYLGGRKGEAPELRGDGS